MRRSPTKVLVDSSGNEIVLAEEMGRGGEGAVFTLKRRALQVAKIYHKRPTCEQVAKLSAMRSFATPELLAVTAWPVDLVFECGNICVGFVMEKVARYRQIHDLYRPQSRRQHFSDVNFDFILHAAANVARAFACAHDHRVVIGDVNPGGIVVARDGRVRLLDCDSFQVACGGKTFPCRVGVGAFTPPELQGANLASCVRSQAHDLFGLAVILFHLLFLGRHPFAGRPMLLADMTIEQAITEFRFAYSLEPKGLAPPPHVPPLAFLTADVAELFEHAFGEDLTARPTASVWVDALEGLRATLVTCKQHPVHVYPGSARKISDLCIADSGPRKSCPWCAIEATSGLAIFPVRHVEAIQMPVGRAFEAACQRARSCVLPVVDEARTLLAPGVVNVPAPSLPAQAAARGLLRWRWACLLAVAILSGVTVLVPSGVVPGFLALAIGAPMAVFFLAFERVRQPFLEQRSHALRQYDDAVAAWEELRLGKARPWVEHQSATQALAKLHSSWDRLPEKHKGQRKKLASTERSRQRRQYLACHRLVEGAVPGVGPGLVQYLKRLGIETAADIEPAWLAKSVGQRSVTALALLSWRQGLEKDFARRARTDGDKSAGMKLRRKQETEVQKLEDEARRLSAALAETIQLANLMREDRKQALIASTANLHQSEADCTQIRWP